MGAIFKPGQLGQDGFVIAFVIVETFEYNIGSFYRRGFLWLQSRAKENLSEDTYKATREVRSLKPLPLAGGLVHLQRRVAR